MKTQIDEDRLFEAYLKGKLGSEEHYVLWTPFWALRSKIWQKKGFRKSARNTLGDVVMDAIDTGDVDGLRQLAQALEDLMQFERSPQNALLADVYYAVEELNGSYPAFSRADLVDWLNEEMEAVVSPQELEGALEALGLADSVPKGKRKIKK